MKELIFQFIDQYVLWGLLLIAVLAVFLLTRIHSQLKRLNRSLGMVTGNIQEYFRVIMAEDTEAESEWEEAGEVRRGVDFRRENLNGRAADGETRYAAASNHEMKRKERFLSEEEREIPASRRREQTSEEEEVFNSVLQEFFS